MQIQLENKNKHTIQSYTEHSITIQDLPYEKSLIVNAHTLIDHWPIQKLALLAEDDFLTALLSLEGEIILIGHAEGAQHPPFSFLERCSKRRIGVECMSIGAACRTFNVLLNEERPVILGLIF